MSSCLKERRKLHRDPAVRKWYTDTSHSNLEFSTRMPLISNTTALHRTFLDTLGRTALTLTALNVVDEARDRELVVTYDYPSSAIYRKPLTIVAGMLAVFCVSCVVGNLDVSIGRKRKVS